MVKIRPVIAQNFIKLPVESQQLLISNNVVPVNEVFFETYENRDFEILLLYGSFGSGKSIVVADMLIDNCLNDEYFKCAYGRKVFDSVRMSVFDTLCDRIEERGFQKYFDYSRKPNSSMWIQCRENKNLFIPFGCDNPGKLLSAKDITHFMCEQFEQFEFEDFQIFFSRLRTQKALTQFFAMFNSTFITDSHWIKKLFFNNEVISDKVNISDYNIRKLFCNYPDNAFLDKEKYEKTLWLSAGFDEKVFREIARGDWGSDDTRNLFAYAFNKKQHVVDITNPAGAEFMKLDSSLPVHLIFDFNVDPMTCLVAQRNGIKWCKVIDEYRLRTSDTFELCERILVDYGDYFLVATGDASGRQRKSSSRGHKSDIFILKQELGLSVRQVQFPTRNPSISDTRVLMNAIFKKHGNFWISSKCLFLIDDLQTITVDEIGDIEEKKTEQGKLKGHLLANCRYLMWNYFRSFLLNNK